MNLKISISSATLMLLLGACSSSPVKDNYYSLSLGSYDATNINSATKRPKKLSIVAVQLPRFLRQQGLVRQVGEHTIDLANHHLWGEPLDEGIGKVLIRELMAKSNTIFVEQNSGRWTADSHCTLRIEIDRFHVTDGNRVVSSGRYWLASADELKSVVKSFDNSNTLRRDGYNQVVAQLRTSLAQLAADIVAIIDDSEVCENAIQE